EEKSQGWTALIMDTNGNGKRDAYVEPDQPVDPAKDKRFGAAFYSVAPAPASRRRRDSRRAAAMSIATACSGRRSRAATSPASIAASARLRSTDRRLRASTVPRAGRSTPDRWPNS